MCEVILSYDQGYRDGEHNRECDIAIAIQFSRTYEELLEQLQGICNDHELELGSEWQ